MNKKRLSEICQKHSKYSTLGNQKSVWYRELAVVKRLPLMEVFVFTSLKQTDRAGLKHTSTVNPLSTNTRYTDKICYYDNLNVTKPSLKRWRLMRNYAKTSNICFGYLIEAILTNIQNMFYEEIRIKQGLSYILFCPLRILYNSKFIIMATL